MYYNATDPQHTACRPYEQIAQLFLPAAGKIPGYANQYDQEPAYHSSAYSPVLL